MEPYRDREAKRGEGFWQEKGDLGEHGKGGDEKRRKRKRRKIPLSPLNVPPTLLHLSNVPLLL